MNPFEGLRRRNMFQFSATVALRVDGSEPADPKLMLWWRNHLYEQMHEAALRGEFEIEAVWPSYSTQEERACVLGALCDIRADGFAVQIKQHDTRGYVVKVSW